MKKKRDKSFLVTIIGDDDAVLLEKKVIHLPLKEEVIIQQSSYFFDDPEPCMIHRSAVMKKIFSEFIDYFEGLFSHSDSTQIETELPDDLMQKLDIKDPIKSIWVRDISME